MITLIRWYLMKSKEIKFKLALYSFLEQGVKEITDNQDELQQKFVHEFAEMIHQAREEAGSTEQVPS